jgi:predicted adenylyl cyclase CyaB
LPDEQKKLMPRNVEIKARLTNAEAQHARAAQLSDVPLEVIAQEDVFFNVPRGRLKLRFLSSMQGQLIFYQRRDESGPTTSTYKLFDTDQPHQLKALLEAAYGIRNVVRKTRHLYRVGRTRIHIDEVESLGHFLELEVVLAEAEAPSAGEFEARDLMQQLGVADTQLISGAYVDLLQQRAESQTD